MIPLWVCLILVAIILGLIMFYYYSQYRVRNLLQKSLQPQEESVTPSPHVKDATSDQEGQSLITGDGTAKVILLHAPWCGHCRNMMKSYVSAAASSSKEVTWHRVDANVSPTLVRRDDVKGFPTIFGVTPSGQLKVHNGGRDEQSLLTFAKSLTEKPVILNDVAEESVKKDEEPLKQEHEKEDNIEHEHENENDENEEEQEN